MKFVKASGGESCNGSILFRKLTCEIVEFFSLERIRDSPANPLRREDYERNIKQTIVRQQKHDGVTTTLTLKLRNESNKKIWLHCYLIFCCSDRTVDHYQ